MDLFHKLYRKSKRCPICNATFTEEDHTCNILGRKITVADDKDVEGNIVEGGIAQVIYVHETIDKETKVKSNEHLLFYSSMNANTGKNDYFFELVDLYKENIQWTFHEEETGMPPLESDFHNPDNWEVYDINQLGINSVYLFRGVCMYYIKPSLVEHAGRGAFAARRYEKGETIAYYDGKDVTDAAPKKTDYVLEIEHRRVDGFGAFHGLQYINDARGSEFRNNIRITRNGKFVVMKSKAIPVGRELLVSYGEQYWSTRDESSKKKKNYDNMNLSINLAKEREIATDNRQLTATTEDISSIKTGNDCGIWTILYILDELYPEETIDFSRLTSTWFVKMRAHIIWTLLKRITPSFVEVRENKLYLDNVFIGPLRFKVTLQSYKGQSNSIVDAHTMAFEKDRYPSVKTPYGIVEMYAPTFNKLQQGTMINDAAIRGYLLLCLSEKTKDALVLDSPMAYGSAVEYLQRSVVRAHRTKSRTTKFVKIFQVINIQEWHWYVLRYDATAEEDNRKKIQMRNNITTLQKKGAKRQFEQFISWYEGFSLQCATWGCEHPVGKRDSFCSKYHRTCASCKEKWIASNKKSPLIRQKKKLGNDKDLHKRLTCPICKEALGVDAVEPKRKHTVDLVTVKKKTKIETVSNIQLETKIKWLEASVNSLKDFCASHHPKIPSLFTFVWPSQVVQAYHAWSEPTMQSLNPEFGENCAESVEVVSTKIPNCTFYGVVAKKACPINSWLKFKAYATSSSILSDYAITIQKQTYDIMKNPKKWKKSSLRDGHYVNELPEDFLFQTMRLAVQMRYYPKQLTKADVNVMLHNVRNYWMILTRLFTNLYIPLKTFGQKYYGPIYVLDDNRRRRRVILGYTIWGQSNVINDHDSFTWNEPTVTGKSGFVTLLVDEENPTQNVFITDRPSPYSHGSFFLHALVEKAKEMGCVSPSYTLPSFSLILKPIDILIKAMTPNCILVPYPVFSGESIKKNVVARVTAIREIEAGEEWYLNYKYGSRAERDKDGKPWYPSAWCLNEEHLVFQYNAKTWVEMLVHPSVYT